MTSPRTSAVHVLLVFYGFHISQATLADQYPKPLPPPAGSDGIETKFCDFYNGTYETTEECSSQENAKKNHCLVLWHIDRDGNPNIKLKGCFIDTTQCNSKNCTLHNAKIDLLYCCCQGDMCNKNMTFPGYPPPTEQPPAVMVSEIILPPEQDNFMMILVYTLTPLSILFIMLIAVYFIYRHKKINLFNELPTIEPSLSCPPSPIGAEELGSLPVVLREVRARGRFGAVWRAHLHQREVAVKIFPIQDKQSWLSEQEIFKLPRMNHPNILQYIGVDKKGDNLQSEYWLITAYHEKGSLCDYLKAHTLTWPEACKIAATMARGLTHLHDESSGGPGGHKPAIAHRDFKSKNVLLKNDMSACIADFGLALVFQPGKPCGDTHGQVGTRRYMAPEVLEGAINFTKDAFLRIDMYACGLVLWEIISRCVERGDPPGEYRLPFEEEVGAHPGLEEMQDAVALRKLRPKISPLWRMHPGLLIICDTMEECWDHDAEARLSASCVLERVTAQTRRVTSQSAGNNNCTTPLLIEDALPLKDSSN